MNRLSIVAAVLAAATLLPACKKDESSGNAATGAPSGSAVAAASGAAAAPTAATPPADEGVKITKKPPVVGSKMSEDYKSATTLKLTLGKKAVDISEEEGRAMDEEILEVTGNAITKLKVTYTSEVKSSTEGGKPARVKKSLLVGKTYVIALKNGKTTVLNDKEKPAPAAEAKLVAKHFDSFGKPDPVVEALPDRAFKPGDSATELADAMSKQLKGSDDGTTIEDVKVKFKGRENDQGVFELTLTMKTGGPFKMSMPLQGTFAMRVADGHPTAMTLAGPINLILTDKDKAAGVEGQGTLKNSSTYTYK